MTTSMLCRAGMIACLAVATFAGWKAYTEAPQVTPQTIWRAALAECRYQREVEACAVESSSDCEVIRMANASDWPIKDPAGELRRCLGAGAGLHLSVGDLR